MTSKHSTRSSDWHAGLHYDRHFVKVEPLVRLEWACAGIAGNDDAHRVDLQKQLFHRLNLSLPRGVLCEAYSSYLES